MTAALRIDTHRRLIHDEHIGAAVQHLQQLDALLAQGLAARPGLAQLGIYLYYLPAYSPELTRIEPVFKQVKIKERVAQLGMVTNAILALVKLLARSMGEVHGRLRIEPQA